MAQDTITSEREDLTASGSESCCRRVAKNVAARDRARVQAPFTDGGGYDVATTGSRLDEQLVIEHVG